MNELHLTVIIFFAIFVLGCALAEIFWFTLASGVVLFQNRDKFNFTIIGLLVLFFGLVNPFTARVVHNNLVNYVGEL